MYVLVLEQFHIFYLLFLAQIGVVIEDKEFVSSHMNGKPWKAGRFSLTLRLSLWSEHLGLQPGEVHIQIHLIDSSKKCFSSE